MPMVEEYWSGVLRRMQAEIEVFNNLITHAGEKGRANELTLAQVISRLVPQRYAVGSGVLIDVDDQFSQQTDIVIYNQSDEPAILAQSTQILFPVENVRLCIEVKTTVGKEEIEDACAKRDSVNALHPTNGKHPPYALVGFSGDLSVDTAARHLTDSERPLDLVAILRDGLVAGWDRLLQPVDAQVDVNAYTVGMACLDSAVQAVLLDRLGDGPETRFVRNIEHKGSIFPIVRRRVGERIISNPARALLLFCDGLLRLLAERDSGTPPTLSRYITDEGRSLLDLHQVVIQP